MGEGRWRPTGPRGACAYAVVLLAGWTMACAGASHPAVAVEAPEPEIATWAHQLGSILEPATECVNRHPGPGATIVSVRTLATGETSIMTRSPGHGAVACVHDGYRVVYQARVELDPEVLSALPFVTLAGSPEPHGAECLSVQRIRWGSALVGWLGEPTCHEKEIGRGSD